MLSPGHTDQTLVKYLLGDDVEESIERDIEQQYSKNPEFYEQVVAIEDDLMALYLKGQLGDREKSLFEHRFLISERRSRRLNFLSSLISYTARSAHDSPRHKRSGRAALKVFVCGTHEDLSEERRAVLDSVRSMKLQHDSMEFFGARANRPIETCLQEVRETDIVIVICGYRYGSMVPGLEVSYSEAEYQEAFRTGKPCLVYMRDESTPILPRFVERDSAKVQLLDRFRAVLMERHTVAYFKNANDLAVRVTIDVEETIRAVGEAYRSGTTTSLSLSPKSVESEINEIVEAALAQGFTAAELVSTIRHGIASSLMLTGRRLPVVYLCHSEAEEELADSVRNGLAAYNISLWEPTRAEAHPDLLREITEGFDKADLVVVLISRRLHEDAWSRRETDLIVARRMATSRRGVVLPVLVQDSPIPSVLRDIKSIDLRGKPIAEVAKQTVQAVIGRLTEKFLAFPTGATGPHE